MMHQKRLDLEEEVYELQEILEQEEDLNQVLTCTLHGPLACRSCFSSSFVPLQVQLLLAELAMVEEEITCLEKKVEILKLYLYQEREQNKECDLQKQRQQLQWQIDNVHFPHRLRGRKDLGESPQSPYTETRGRSPKEEIYASHVLDAESSSVSYTKTNGFTKLRNIKEIDGILADNEAEYSLRWGLPDEENSTETPNKLSEQLIKTLIRIFRKLHKSSAQLESKDGTVPKLNISCMSSRSLMCRSSYNSKSIACSSNTVQMRDPYGVLLEGERLARDIGAYKNFIHFTRSSLDMSRITLCVPAMGKLRLLMHKICTVELSLLTYKQKLAFWINTYNACIMHAFLQHGLPSSPEKPLELLNKAAINVGGIVLNALAIEHFILRHSSDTQNSKVEEKEGLLRHVYGLGYPEPNVTFALCRGSWSSPSLRVYTAENIVNELEQAKVEYLEASIGITIKKKIVIPKLLHWHMHDFADDVESLLEWTYSQLPRSGSLKKSIMECLSGDTKVPLAKMVEIQPYESEFRYLLPT